MGGIWRKYLDGVEGVAEQRDGDAAARAREHVLGRPDGLLVEVALLRRGYVRRVRGEQRIVRPANAA